MDILTKLIFFSLSSSSWYQFLVFTLLYFLQHMKGKLLLLNGKSFLLKKLDFYLANKEKNPNNFLFACFNIACEFLNLPTTLSKDIFFFFSIFLSFFQSKQIENFQNVLLLFIWKKKKHFLLSTHTINIIHLHNIRVLSSLFFPNQLI